MRWDEDTEHILSTLADESQVNYKLHKKLHEYYSSWNRWFSLPLIIFSSIAGSGNFISQNYPSIEKSMITSIGGLSIITGIIGAISSFLKFAELSSTHLLVYNQWQKFYSQIRFQLSLTKNNRTPCDEIVKALINEYDRLVETSPHIPNRFIKKIKKKIDNIPDKGNFIMPHFLNGISHIEARQKRKKTTELLEAIVIE